MEITYQASTKITYQHVIEKTEHFTFPSIRKKVLSMPIREPYSGVWALKDNKLLGMILADKATNGISELFSFYVFPEERNKGIGKQLLTALEILLKKQGVKYVQSIYNSDWKSLEVIQKLLVSHQWSKPELSRIVAEIGIDKYHVVPWPELKLPSDFSIFPWDSLTNKDRKEIEKLRLSKEVPNEFNPFQHEGKIYMPASIGLRFNNKIAGWNIVYSLSEDKTEYNNLFLLKEYRKAGYAIKLLHEAFGKQYEDNVPEAAWVIHGNNLAAMKIFKRIAGDHLNKYVEINYSAKKLN